MQPATNNWKFDKEPQCAVLMVINLNSIFTTFKCFITSWVLLNTYQSLKKKLNKTILNLSAEADVGIFNRNFKN